MKTIRAKFIKRDDLKFIGHLDLIRLFKRAFIRANIAVEYTQGYNPQPRLSFATALPLGAESDGEYLEVVVQDNVEIKSFTDGLNKELPNGIKVLKASFVDGKKKIMSLIRWSSYIVEINFNDKVSEEDINGSIKDILEKKEITVKKHKKGKTKEVEIRSLIKDIDILLYEEDRIIIKTMLKTGSVGNLKPDIIVDLLKENLNIGVIDDIINIKRLELFVEEEGKIVTPL